MCPEKEEGLDIGRAEYCGFEISPEKEEERDVGRAELATFPVLCPRTCVSLFVQRNRATVRSWDGLPPLSLFPILHYGRRESTETIFRIDPVSVEIFQ